MQNGSRHENKPLTTTPNAYSGMDSDVNSRPPVRGISLDATFVCGTEGGVMDGMTPQLVLMVYRGSYRADNAVITYR